MNKHSNAIILKYISKYYIKYIAISEYPTWADMGLSFLVKSELIQKHCPK